MSTSSMSLDTMLKLAAFARDAEACDPRINTRAKLESAIKRVLIISLAKQSHRFTGETATEEAFVEMRAMEEYHGNPRFHAFIDSQCMELMRVFDRYEPN